VSTLATIGRHLGAAGRAAALWLLSRALMIVNFVRRNLKWRRAKAIWRITRSAIARYNRDDGAAIAGYIAFSAFLAVFPFAIFATALAGSFVDPADSEAMLGALFRLAPDHVAQTLEPVVMSVTQGQGDRLLTVSAIGALWVASNAIEAIRVAFDRAYGSEKPRHFVVRRIVALGFVVLATVTFGLLAFLVIGAPLALSLAESYLGVSAPFGVGALRYMLGLWILSVLLFEMHLLLPARRPPRRRLFPGIATSVALWAAGAYAFSIYLASAPSYSITYGALAGVIVTLLFFYLTGAAILFGAQINAVLLQFRHPAPRDNLP
jgi:membrane protein